MKMMKAVKKLKFWSRKKKKKALFIDNPPPPPPPPPPCHCQYQYYCPPYEPSAPPLPTSSSSSSWVEYDHEAQDTVRANSEFISFTSSNPAQAQDPTFGPRDFSSVPQDPTMPAAASITSYQQYMVPHPAYGVPLVPQVRRERRGGAFGCMFAFGAHLFRCFFPCFHIREANK
ncbi:uncharacterized protein LOC113759308 [Coffea eugenioides]|uniref:uncharacterized protein LOC113759308 n=1 Tax=Coffea eugenioides TaxID=49369 RepID=UPI000F612167|nr:uncharacterized protein LOC113759308 [Coffea eugenioides]